MEKKLPIYLTQFWHKVFKILTVLTIAGSAFPQKLLAQTDTPNIFGTIAPPAGVDIYQDKVGSGEIGIILFLSNIIRLITVAAGIWTMFNIISAGWIYLTAAGDASATEKVSAKITNSIIGLGIVALAYTIAGAVGYFIFGDASYILNPQLFTILD